MSSSMNEIQQLISDYAHNPSSPESTFKLGSWYFNHRYYAAAFSYFRYTIESTEETLIVPSLIKMGYCWFYLGDRYSCIQLISDYIIKTDPYEPKGYLLKCIAEYNTKNYLNVINIVEFIKKFSLHDSELDDFYKGSQHRN